MNGELEAAAKETSERWLKGLSESDRVLLRQFVALIDRHKSSYPSLDMTSLRRITRKALIAVQGAIVPITVSPDQRSQS